MLMLGKAAGVIFMPLAGSVQPLRLSISGYVVVFGDRSSRYKWVPLHFSVFFFARHSQTEHCHFMSLLNLNNVNIHMLQISTRTM